MIISEKQIMFIVKYLQNALDNNLSIVDEEHAKILLEQIADQQSEELKVVE
tara:strand:+ start:8232 stop:8384 length:153 start_codon:yes stop_codon:yes gene_type:complete